MAALKAEDFGIELGFGNYRCPVGWSSGIGKARKLRYL